MLPLEPILPFRLRLLWCFARLLHIIALGVHNILHTSQGMLFKRSIFRLQQWRVNIDIASHFFDDMAKMHAMRDGLDIAPNDLNQVLEDQGE